MWKKSIYRPEVRIFAATIEAIAYESYMINATPHCPYFLNYILLVFHEELIYSIVHGGCIYMVWNKDVRDSMPMYLRFI